MYCDLHPFIVNCCDGDVKKYLQSTMCRNRRKFRSETSDNMDSWQSRGGKSQRERRRKEVRRSERRKRGKKEEAGAQKVGKWRFTVFFSNDLWLRKVEK